MGLLCAGAMTWLNRGVSAGGVEVWIELSENVHVWVIEIWCAKAASSGQEHECSAEL